MKTRKYKSRQTRKRKPDMIYNANILRNKLHKSNVASSDEATSVFAFCDGSKVYETYDKKYKRHTNGLVILGPPGIGKTTFVRKNEREIIKSGNKLNWIDQDDLFGELGVKWHYNSHNPNDFRLNYMRADYITEQSKQLGYWLIGSLFWEYKADAIVIPPWNIHGDYVKKRTDLNPDMVKQVRKLLFKQAKQMKIPLFISIEEAVAALTN
tara:strand:+ start:5019 stop:5648 length:630 start_codon:yes stop_codon:yes gene_type:complete